MILCSPLDEARILIAMAREAVNLFQDASEKQRVAFLTLLLFNLRKQVSSAGPG
jgi:hypothetical protein